MDLSPGKEAYEEISHVKPEVRLLFFSGWLAYCQIGYS